MNDHIPDPTKMINDTPRTDAVYFKQGATMYDLANEMKLVERELNAANGEIERLTAKVAQLYEGAEEQKQRIHSLIAERDTARQQSDQKVSIRKEFRHLLGTDDIEQGITVVCDWLGYIKQLETENDAMRADLLLWRDQEVKL
jgi:predicted RNase H-like nuclease (RuvC/YqgF family)